MSEPKHLTIYELTDKTCKWPVTERSPWLFCGHPKLEGSSYHMRYNGGRY